MSEKAPFDRKILDRLKDYNIPYREGSWDHFESFRKEKEDKKRLIFFFYKIAAMLFLALATGWGIHKLTNNSKSTATGKPAPTNKTKTGRYPTADIVQNQAVYMASNKPKIENEQRHWNVVSGNKQSIARVIQADKLSHLNDQKFTDHPNTGTGLTSTRNFGLHQDLDFVALPARKLSYIPIYLKNPSIPFQKNGMEEELPHRKSRPGYSIVLNQQVNRATNSLPGYSFGLGGFTDIPLAAKLEFSAGVSFGRQSFRIQNEKLAFNPATSGSPHLDRIDYRWMNAEIPLHVRYRITPRRTWNLYVSGGMSVLGTFGQKFDYSYSNKRIVTTVLEVENGPAIVSTQTLEEQHVVRDERVRDKFGFGSTVHFALGFDYPWKVANLSVEPFVRYPIGRVTSEKLQFFSLGIQLRWSFKSPRMFGQEPHVNSRSQTE